MTARTFGRKVAGDDEMARRVEAFLASERARKTAVESEARAATPSPRPSARSASSPGRRKSMFLAYFFLLGLGALSAHRFYLGYRPSAFAQAGLWFGGWLMVAGTYFWGLLLVLIAVIWQVVDLFLIPGLTRKANERARSAAVAEAFA